MYRITTFQLHGPAHTIAIIIDFTCPDPKNLLAGILVSSLPANYLAYFGAVLGLPALATFDEFLFDFRAVVQPALAAATSTTYLDLQFVEEFLITLLHVRPPTRTDVSRRSFLLPYSVPNPVSDDHFSFRHHLSGFGTVFVSQQLETPYPTPGPEIEPLLC